MANQNNAYEHGHCYPNFAPNQEKLFLDNAISTFLNSCIKSAGIADLKHISTP